MVSCQRDVPMSCEFNGSADAHCGQISSKFDSLGPPSGHDSDVIHLFPDESLA
jgi:hypothetical protein